MIVTTGTISDHALDKLPEHRRTPLNFEPSLKEVYLRTDAWYEDHHLQPLPSERPGPPEPDGPFAIAKEEIDGYLFAEPRFVVAAWDDRDPFVGRTMALEGRFYGLRFPMGLRIGGVTDVTEQIDGRTVTRWGWHYWTLAGHLERGEMAFEVRKWHDTGAVEFRIDAFSAKALVRNPIVRLGLALFGRWMQQRYGRAAKKRILHHVEGQLHPRRRRPRVTGRSPDQQSGADGRAA